MSLNLHLKINNKKINLWQTPTQITNMCMIQPNGNIPDKLTGIKAKHALNIYKQYILGEINGRWDSVEEIEGIKLQIKKHLFEINKELSDAIKIEVYIL